MSRRRRLGELRRELESWDCVSPSARAFHRTRRTLGEDLDEESSRLLPWGGSDALIELEERAARLRPVAEALRGLFERRGQVEARLDAVAARAESSSVAAVDPSELSHWRVGLAKTAESARSTIDLEIEYRQLDELARQIEAAAGRRIPPPAADSPLPEPVRPKAPPLARSPPIETRAPSAPASTGVDPSSSVPSTADRAAVRRLDEIGQRLWDWAVVASAQSDAVAELSNRKENAVARLEDGAAVGDSGGESVGDVIEASEVLLKAMTGAAAAERLERRERLDNRLQTLSQLVAHPDLEQQAAALFARPVESGRDHRFWLAAVDELENVFRDRLHNDQRKVDGAFEAAVGDLSRGLTDLETQPISEAVAASVERLARGLRELASVTGVEARFDAFDRLRALGHELDLCRQQAEAEMAAHLERRERLDCRITALQTLAGTLDGFDPVLSVGEYGTTGNADRIAGDAAQRLEVAQQAIDELEKLVAAEEARFVAACAAQKRRLGERDRALASVLDVAVSLGLLDAGLLEAGPLETASPTRYAGASTDADPGAAAEALEAARQGRLRLESALAHVEVDVAERLAPALAELEGLDEQRLRPGERQELAELIAEAAELASFEPGAPEQETFESPTWAPLEARLGWLRRQRDLVDRVEGDRRRAVARRRQLVSRLERLERRRLAEVCPKVLVDRAHALVHGLEESELAEAAAQLALAEQLLARLEAHAHQLLADQLERVRARLAGEPSPAARSALAELEAAPAGELPPLALRRRLFHLLSHQAPGEEAL